MAGVKWIRLDTQMFENHKLLYLKEDKQYRAIVIHLEAMTYSGRQGLAGFVPKAALRIIGATVRDDGAKEDWPEMLSETAQLA